MTTATAEVRIRSAKKERELASFRKIRTDRAIVSRQCLCCGGRFMSEGAHNRMCDRCRLLPTE